MNVLLVNGSPHKNGGTARSLAIVGEELKQGGINTTWFQIGTKPVRGCIACQQCARTNRCHFNDDKCNELIEQMGNAVLWAYFELYGQQDVISYVLEEEAPCLLSDPAWTEEEAKTFRGTMDFPSFIKPEQDTVQGNFMANLFHDHVNRDWREEVREIHLPVLIMMGRKSHYASRQLWAWLHTSIQGSEIVLLDGGHGLHLDCEKEFIETVQKFLEMHAV